jgi:hypothetical protein
MRTFVAILLLAGTFTTGSVQDIAEPKPQPAIPAVLEIFDAFSVVAIGDFHRTKDINDFILAPASRVCRQSERYRGRGNEFIPAACPGQLCQ